MAKQYDEDLRRLFKAAKPLSRDEQRRLVEAAQNGDHDARDQMVHCWSAYVIKTASIFCSPAVPIEDLVQIGVLGVLRAIDRFDLSRKTEEGIPLAFSTYAPWIIKQVIIDEVDTRSHLIRIAGTAGRRKSKIVAEAADRVRNGIRDVRDPNLTQNRNVYGAHKQNELLDDPALVRDYAKEAEEQADREAEIAKLRKCVKKIKDARIRQVMEYRLEGKIFAEIGELMHCSKATASSLYYKGFEQLQQMLLGP